MRQPSGPSSVACDVLSVQSVQNCAEPVRMDRLDCPLKGKIHPLNQAKKMIPTGRRKFFSASRAKHFFIRQPKKITWSGRPKYPPEKRTQKAPRQAGKIFPETEKPLLAQKNSFLQERRKNASPCGWRFCCVFVRRERKSHKEWFLCTSKIVPCKDGGIMKST